MRTPASLSLLVDEGILDAVLRPLMSGKEAQVYLVEAAGQRYVAKIYKEAQARTFKHRADYTEGRKVRNSRDQRAINKRTRHGRDQDEAAWRSTEVDMIYRLTHAGVRVPAPYQYIDGVLIMELVRGEDGEPAPRLGDVQFSPEQAVAVFERLLRETIRMLCAGVVHGDLSDFNVLMSGDGPVIIDFPQAVDPAKNANARKLLLRDVDNLQRFLRRFAPSQARKAYAEEMWSLYESNRLTPESVLRGNYRGSSKKADTGAVLELIGEANEDERRRRSGRARGRPGRGKPPLPRTEVIGELSASSDRREPPREGSAAARPRRVEIIVNPSSRPGARPPPKPGARPSPKPSSTRVDASRSGPAGSPPPGDAKAQQGTAPARKRRRRRGNRGGGPSRPEPAAESTGQPRANAPAQRPAAPSRRTFAGEDSNAGPHSRRRRQR